MMMLFPFHSFFISNLILSTIFIFSAESWFSVWAGLEYNLISFIPLLLSKPTNKSSESAIKYFIIQAVASIILLLIFILSLMQLFTNMNLLMAFPLMVKLGIAPFHQWVPNVLSSISWNNVFILVTWQKLAPLFLISTTSNLVTHSIIFTLAGFSSLISGMGGINQSQIRALIAYSSIGHSGWILATALISTKLTMIYMFVYMLNLYPLIMIFKYLSIQSLNSAMNLMKMNKMTASMVFLLFFSLGGMPPFLGFIPKILLMKSLVMASLYFPLVLLVMGSLMNLYYYLFFSLIYCSAANLQLPYMSQPVIKSSPFLVFSLIFLLPAFIFLI